MSTGDNIYEVSVAVTDGESVSTQDVLVNVEDDGMTTTIEQLNADLGLLADHVGDLYESGAATQEQLDQLQADFEALDMTSIINDAATSGANITWSVDKIVASILESFNQAKADLLGGDPPEALNTIFKLANELTSVGGRVSVLETDVAALQAKFDSNGLLKSQYLPSFVTGGLTFKGVFDATADTLPTPAEGEGGNDGWMYTVSIGGTVNTAAGATVVQAGDTLISDGVAWVAIARVDAVTSVNGKTGAVVLAAGDITYTASNESGLTATTIKGALDELGAAIKAKFEQLGDLTALIGTVGLAARIQTARTDGVVTAAA